MLNRNVLNSPRLLELNKNRRRVFKSNIFLSFFGLLAIFVLIVYISHTPDFNIGAVVVSGNSSIDGDAIQKIVKNEIAGNYMWIFPKSNVLIYPKNDIQNKLYAKFPAIKNITLSVENKKTLAISISERVGLFTWCGVYVDLQSQNPLGIFNEGKCYFMDESGFIFDEAPFFSGEVYFKFYGSTDTKANSPSGTFFSKPNFQKFISFIDALKNMGLKPVALYEVGNGGDVMVFLSASKLLPRGPEIMFKMDEDFQKIEENLEAALTTEPLQSDFKNKYSSLLYIDLRYGNKVYYKFQ